MPVSVPSVFILGNDRQRVFCAPARSERMMTFTQPDSIEVKAIDGHWTVHLVENGQSSDRDFDIEKHARSFADGQRARLKIGNPCQAKTPHRRDV
jgi:hypothetical protein